jgi:hypothetical protein
MTDVMGTAMLTDHAARLRAEIKQLRADLADAEAVNTEHMRLAGEWAPLLLEAIETLTETARATAGYRWGFGQHDDDLERVWEQASALLPRLRAAVEPVDETSEQVLAAVATHDRAHAFASWLDGALTDELPHVDIRAALDRFRDELTA